jgi:peptidoglycan biosynthesis protein MviN/MurJ (putative lipid II flippase)
MLGSTLWLTLATLIGLVAGFAREWLLIDAWGASLRSDAFLVALFLPEAVRMALATGLFSSAALPLYQERDAAQREAWLSALTGRILGCALLITVLFHVAAPLWVMLIGPGLSDEGRMLAMQSLQLLAWCVPGFMLHALLCIPLQAHARFVLDLSRRGWGAGDAFRVGEQLSARQLAHAHGAASSHARHGMATLACPG